MNQESNINNFSPKQQISRLHDYLLKACIDMAEFALTNGIQVEPATIMAIEDVAQQLDTPSPKPFSATRLVTAHNELVRLIAPAKPSTLPVAREYYKKIWFLPRIPKLGLIGQLMALAMVFMSGFILTSLPEAIDGELIAKDFTELDGSLLFIYMMMLLSAAGLGATFAALFQVNRLIKRQTFDPKQTTPYYIQILLGIVAGLFVSQLLDFDRTEATLDILSKPTLALLGGFSSTVIYRFLKQLLAAIESLVGGASENTIETQRQLLRIDAQQMVQESRLKTVADLLPLRDSLPVELRQMFDDLISGFPGSSISNE